MSDQRRVVVGIDGSESSEQLLGLAGAEARRRRATLDVITTWHVPTLSSLPAFGVGVPVDQILDDLRAALHDALGRLGLGGDDPPTRLVVVEGHPAATLIEASRNATLVIVGSRSRSGVAGALLGSTSTTVAAHATCPVMIVPAAALQSRP